MDDLPIVKNKNKLAGYVTAKVYPVNKAISTLQWVRSWVENSSR